MEYIIIIFFIILHIRIIYKEFDRLNLLHFFFLGNILFYGLYPLSDFINDSYDFDLQSLCYVYTYLSLSNFIVYICYNNFFSQKIKSLTFKKINYWASKKISNRLLFLAILSVSLVILYFFQRYGLIFRTFSEEATSEINSYGVVTGTIILPSLYLILLITVNKFFGIEKQKGVFLLIIICTELYFLFYARREFILSVLLIYIVYIIHIGKKNIASLRNIIGVTLMCFVSIVASNLYQNMRSQILTYSTTREIVLEKSILEMMVDFNVSKENMKDRGSSLLQFLNTVERINSINMGDGIILKENIKTSIPSLLYLEKKSVNEDELIANILHIPTTDYSATIAISSYIDFYVLAFLIYPFLILCFLFSTSHMILLVNNIFFKVGMTTILIYSLYSIEGSYTALFMVIRMFILFVFIDFFFKIKR